MPVSLMQFFFICRSSFSYNFASDFPNCLSFFFCGAFSIGFSFRVFLFLLGFLGSSPSLESQEIDASEMQKASLRQKFGEVKKRV